MAAVVFSDGCFKKHGACRATADILACESWSRFAPGIGCAGASAAGCAKASFPSDFEGECKRKEERSSAQEQCLSTLHWEMRLPYADESSEEV